MSFEGHFFNYLATGSILVVALVTAIRLARVTP